MRETLLPIHIAAGGLAIVLGAAALIARKGGPLHRRIGLIFVYAMLGMGLTGAVLALRQNLWNANAVGGWMAAYLVTTALTTVRPATTGTRRLNTLALTAAIALTLFAMGLGIYGITHQLRQIDGVPTPMMFVFAAIAALSAAGDIRIMYSGPKRGPARLARHLWRMCFALFLATASFFSIGERVAKVLPAALNTPVIRTLPILLALVAMSYWLWRVRSRRARA